MGGCHGGWKQLGLCRRATRLPLEQVMNDSERNLPLAHDDEIGAERLQVLDFGIGMRPCDDLDARIGGASLLHDLTCFECFRYRNQQIACAAEIGGFQDIGTCGVSNDGLEITLAQLRNDIVRILDNEERLTALLQGIGNNAADAAMADKYCMTGQTRSLGRGR